MEELSLGVQFDRAMREFKRVSREVARVRELLLRETEVLKGFKVSHREMQVLTGLRKNLVNKEIASELNVSVRTVKYHVSALLAKTGAMNRLELVRLANANAIEMATSDIVPIRDSDARTA
jgi:DNA-binding NarL/FixJ family response regulator